MDSIMFPTSGLSILLHGVISLPDATSYDKNRLIASGLQNLWTQTYVSTLLTMETSQIQQQTINKSS